MRKLTLAIAALAISISSFATNDIKVSLCNEKSTTVSRTALNSCNHIITTDENWKVKSFVVGFLVDKDYHEIRISGKDFSEKLMTSLKKYSPEKIYIEKIILSNDKNEEMKAENLAIKITE